MRVGHKWLSQPHTARWFRVNLANPSARLVLAALFLISLNAAAAYDSFLSFIAKLVQRAKRLFGRTLFFVPPPPVITARAAENAAAPKHHQ